MNDLWKNSKKPPRTSKTVSGETTSDQCLANLELGGDALITRHLDQLYEALLDANLLKIIEPFSCVEVAHVAKLINLPVNLIETKYVLI